MNTKHLTDEEFGKLEVAITIKGRLELAREEMHEARAALTRMLNDPALKRIRSPVAGAESAVRYLLEYLELKCCHCGKKVDLGYTCCARCADERGP